VSRAELVRLWEDLFDQDPDAAKELFFDALLRDARAEYRRRARKEEGDSKDDGDEEERLRRARVFRPWQPPAPGSAMLPPLPPAAPTDKRAVVLGLRAPPHLARKHGRTPSSEANKPRAV
jgi:hypothetical protein